MEEDEREIENKKKRRERQTFFSHKVIEASISEGVCSLSCDCSPPNCGMAIIACMKRVKGARV